MVAVQLGLQQGFAVSGGQRFAAVLHGDAQARYLAALVQRHHQQDFALIGIFQGILQQARQGLAKARRVAADYPRYLRLGEADQFDVLLFGLGAENVQAILDQSVEVELHIIEFDLPGFELGNVENLVDQREQLVAGAVNGLYVVALLDRQRRPQQQFCHAQHTVHRGADFVTDLGQEFGLGVDFGIAGCQGAAGAEALLAHAPQAFADCQVEQQAAGHRQPQQDAQQPGRRSTGQAQQRRQQHQATEVEHHHGQAEQACGCIALVPVVAADQQHAHGAQGHQGVGHQVEGQGVDEQQHQPAQPDHQHLALQQAVEPWRVAWREEMLGEAQPGQAGQDESQICGGRLRAVPHVPPRAAQVQQDQAAEQHQAVVQRQDQGGVGAAVEEADQVVHDQHHQAAEQHAEQQRLALVGGCHGRRLQTDGRAQLMLGNQAQVDIQGLLAVGQGQYMVAATQGRAGIAGLAPMVQLTQKLVALEGVEVQARKVWGENPQQLFLLAGLQAVVQPEGLFRRGGIQVGEDKRAELVAVTLGAHVAQLQVGLFVEQNGPASVMFGRSREHAEQGQQADDQS